VLSLSGAVTSGQVTNHSKTEILHKYHLLIWNYDIFNFLAISLKLSKRIVFKILSFPSDYCFCFKHLQT